MPGNCRFRVDWMGQEEFKIWLHADSDPTKANCKVCKTTFDIANMGITALRSHSKGRKHQTNFISYNENQRIGIPSFFGQHAPTKGNVVSRFCFFILIIQLSTKRAG